MLTTAENCQSTWELSDYLLFMDVIRYWCGDCPGCIEAKKNALLTALERGSVKYKRRDSKTFKDSVYELEAKGLLLVERESFREWALSVSNDEQSQSLQETMPIGCRSEAAYLNVVGVLLDVILGTSPDGTANPIFETQAKLIDQILEHHGGKAGISQRNLDGKFADAKRNLKGS